MAADLGGARRRQVWIAAVVVAGLTVWNLAVYLPPRLAELGQYGGITADLKREVERTGLEDAVVFVPTDGLLFNDGFHMNDPFLDRGTVFGRDLGARNAELMRAYPDRPSFLWTRGRLQPVGQRVSKRVGP
jgi:hypothetical protein